jgi:hypothetical protein
MDASAMQLGAVIACDNRPIAFFSTKLPKPQQKSSIIKSEHLAMAETLKEFKGMLWGQSIKVFTDHEILTRDSLGPTSDRVYPMEITLRRICPQNNTYKSDT